MKERCDSQWRSMPEYGRLFARTHDVAASLLAGLVAIGASACGAPVVEAADETVERTEEALEGTMDRKPIAATTFFQPSGAAYIWVFARGVGDVLWRRVLRRHDLSWNADWEPVDSGVTDSPAVHTWSSQGMVVYARGVENHLWELFYPDARDPANPPVPWFDISERTAAPTIQLLIGPPVVAGKDDRLAVFAHGQAQGSGGDLGTNLIYEWNHPDLPNQWKEFMKASGTGYTNTFGVEDNLQAAAFGKFNTSTIPKLLTREFFSTDSDEYEPEWETNGAFTSTLIMQGIPAVIKHGPDIRVFVRSGAQLKKINVSANGSTTGWTQNGTCTNVKSSPSLGSEGGTQTPYFACSAPGGGTSLCKQVSNSGCTLLGGTLKSAPTVVSSIIKDVVFYKGGDGDVWMYTTANGHQDLGLPLP